MSKILFFSDLHAHPFKLYSTLDSNGINSRLNDAFVCLDLVIEHAQREHVDLVIFCGDMFHVRKQLSVTAFNGIYERLRKLSEITNVVLLHGNHDQADRAGEQYSIYAFSAFVNVIDKSGWKTVHGVSGQAYNVFALPYQDELHVENLSKVIENGPMFHTSAKVKVPKLFLGHLGINGAVVGADFVYNSVYDANIAGLRPELFDAGFLGHFHMYQHLGHNFYYIGSPIHHNWGDKGQDRGIIIYDTETKLHERIIFSQLPQFIEVNWDDYCEKIHAGEEPTFPNHYVRITNPVGNGMAEDLKEQLRVKWKCRSLEASYPKTKEKIQVRMDVQVGTSISDALPAYIDSNPPEGLDRDFLLQLGRELMEEADQE